MFSFGRKRFQREIPFRFLVYFLCAGVAPLFLFLIVIVLVTMGTDEPLSFSNFSLLSPFYRLILFVVAISLSTMLGVYILHRKVSSSLLDPLSKLHEKNQQIEVGNLQQSLIPPEEIPPDEIGEVMRVRNTVIQKLMKDEAELIRREKFAAIGQLASFIAHDLRTPLTTLFHAVRLIEESLTRGKEKKIQNYLQIILRQATVANQIMSNLLDFAKERKPAKKEVAVNALLKETLHQAIPPENVKVSCHLDEKIPPVLVDPLQMRQVFMNLVLNAVQSMPEGGELEITTKPHNGAVDIHFRDNGCGIDPKTKEKIFTLLYSTKEYGTGLGLAISKQFVETNGGNIAVESALGKGSDFTVSLPTAPQTL